MSTTDLILLFQVVILVSIWGLGAAGWHARRTDNRRREQAMQEQSNQIQHTAVEQSLQTQLTERLVRRFEQAFGPTIAANRYQQIVDALLKSGAYDTPGSRSNLTLTLPDRLRDSLDRQDNPRGDLIGIITRAARWSDECLAQLIDAALYEIRGSAAEKDLLRLRAELRAAGLDAADLIH